jgi:hypothetical protein
MTITKHARRLSTGKGVCSADGPLTGMPACKSLAETECDLTLPTVALLHECSHVGVLCCSSNVLLLFYLVTIL